VSSGGTTEDSFEIQYSHAYSPADDFSSGGELFPRSSIYFTVCSGNAAGTRVGPAGAVMDTRDRAVSDLPLLQELLFEGKV
jgi:hypothetical protein